MVNRLFARLRDYFARIPDWRQVPPPNWRSARKRTDGVYW
jgi:hypothetical protein